VRYLILCFLLSLFSKLSAQDSLKHFYDSGVLSCLEINIPADEDINQVKLEWVYVFDATGNLIWKNARRRFAGYASINLKFHSNGGVRLVEYSSAPDGGIQYFRERCSIDTSGKIIDRRIESHDRQKLLMPSPQIRD